VSSGIITVLYLRYAHPNIATKNALPALGIYVNFLFTRIYLINPDITDFI